MVEEQCKGPELLQAAVPGFQQNWVIIVKSIIWVQGCRHLIDPFDHTFIIAIGMYSQGLAMVRGYICM